MKLRMRQFNVHTSKIIGVRIFLLHYFVTDKINVSNLNQSQTIKAIIAHVEFEVLDLCELENCKARLFT